MKIGIDAINEVLSKRQPNLEKISAKTIKKGAAVVLSGAPTIVKGTEDAFSLVKPNNLVLIPGFEEYIDRFQFEKTCSTEDVELVASLMEDRAKDYMGSREGAIFNVYGYSMPGNEGLARWIDRDGKYEIRIYIKSFKDQ